MTLVLVFILLPVQDAKIACKLTNWTDESVIDSLALACAEVGDFDFAVRYAASVSYREHRADGFQKNPVASGIISTTQANSLVTFGAFAARQCGVTTRELLGTRQGVSS